MSKRDEVVSDISIVRRLYETPPEWVVKLSELPNAMDVRWHYRGDLMIPIEWCMGWVITHDCKHTKQCPVRMFPVKHPTPKNKREGAGVYVGHCAKLPWYVWARCWIGE